MASHNPHSGLFSAPAPQVRDPHSTASWREAVRTGPGPSVMTAKLVLTSDIVPESEASNGTLLRFLLTSSSLQSFYHHGRRNNIRWLREQRIRMARTLSTHIPYEMLREKHLVLHSNYAYTVFALQCCCRKALKGGSYPTRCWSQSSFSTCWTDTRISSLRCDLLEWRTYSIQ
ncbi:hypothetical protein BDV95DRAFT_5704 [Massariosphaeria phaeospora]|uniref:Uncharacterized protein n=1 Tax=Massariosphaeria phaeospora TaxID=100035 RepID=A0A7C8IEU9_9PLEO|nr:hypothetical protein BDV95DRAFT_5704 [Massariosphaeria phaeospora]